eukprot:SAG31_NODE_31112_length_372_cov_0.670330_1_plen_82_part_10
MGMYSYSCLRTPDMNQWVDAGCWLPALLSPAARYRQQVCLRDPRAESGRRECVSAIRSGRPRAAGGRASAVRDAMLAWSGLL